MNFKMSTKGLKKNVRLTLVVDGPKDFIERVESSIHSILANTVPPALYPENSALVSKLISQNDWESHKGKKNSLPPEVIKHLPGPLLPVTDDDEATMPSKPTPVTGGRFEPVAPGEIDRLKPRV